MRESDLTRLVFFLLCIALFLQVNVLAIVISPETNDVTENTDLPQYYQMESPVTKLEFNGATVNKDRNVWAEVAQSYYYPGCRVGIVRGICDNPTDPAVNDWNNYLQNNFEIVEFYSPYQSFDTSKAWSDPVNVKDAMPKVMAAYLGKYDTVQLSGHYTILDTHSGGTTYTIEKLKNGEITCDLLYLNCPALVPYDTIKNLIKEGKVKTVFITTSDQDILRLTQIKYNQNGPSLNVLNAPWPEKLISPIPISIGEELFRANLKINDLKDGSTFWLSSPFPENPQFVPWASDFNNDGDINKNDFDSNTDGKQDIFVANVGFAALSDSKEVHGWLNQLVTAAMSLATTSPTGDIGLDKLFWMVDINNNIFTVNPESSKNLFIYSSGTGLTLTQFESDENNLIDQYNAVKKEPQLPSGSPTPIQISSDEITPIPTTNRLPPFPPITPNGGGGGTAVAIAGSLAGVDFTHLSLNTLVISDDEASGAHFIHTGIAGDPYQGNVDPEETLDLEYTTFAIGLTVPNDDFWVNLNLWEPDRMLGDPIKNTEVGRIMLEADLQMKKDFARFTNPCTSQTGEAYWTRMQEKKKEIVGNLMGRYPAYIQDVDSIGFIPVTRHWIVPDQITAYEKKNELFVESATLSIKSDPVYDKSTWEVAGYSPEDLPMELRNELDMAAQEYGRHAMEVSDEIIKPLVVNEVNNGQYYSKLRTVYTSLALAQWYKEKYAGKDNIFRDIIDTGDTQYFSSVLSWDPRDTWSQYKVSFTEGEYNCTKERKYTEGNYIITESRTFIQGGVDFATIPVAKSQPMPEQQSQLIDEVVEKTVVQRGNTYYFDQSLPLSTMLTASIAGPLKENSKNPQRSDEGFSLSFIQSNLILLAGLVIIIAGVVGFWTRVRKSDEDEFFR